MPTLRVELLTHSTRDAQLTQERRAISQWNYYSFWGWYVRSQSIHWWKKCYCNNGNKIEKRKIMWRMKGRLLAKNVSHTGAICKAATACFNWVWLWTYENYARLTNYLWYSMVTNMQCNLLISFVSGLLCVTGNEFDLWWAHLFAIGGILWERRKLYVFVEKKKTFPCELSTTPANCTHTRSNKYFSNKTDSYANRVRDINKCNEIQFRCEFHLFCSVTWMRTYADNSIFRCQLCIRRTRFRTFGLSTQSASGASCHINCWEAKERTPIRNIQ